MNDYTNLAKQAVEAYIKQGKVIELPEGLPKEMLERKAGVFITIEKAEPAGQKRLRGCIGTVSPCQENIAKEIIANAIAAATGDNRFLPVQVEELNRVKFKVYILGELALVKDKKELNPKKYGILIKTTDSFPPKSALLLPDLIGLDTIEKQLSVCCQKAGIDPTAKELVIYRFEAEKYG